MPTQFIQQLDIKKTAMRMRAKAVTLDIVNKLKEATQLRKVADRIDPPQP